MFRSFSKLAGAVAAVFVVVVAPARAVILYSTAFNNPPFAAAGPWGGVDGWLATDPGNGSAAVTTDGGSAYLGAVAPAASISRVVRGFKYDPVARGTPIIKVNANIAITASTNGRFDTFALAIYNSSRDFLGALLFDNSTHAALSDDGRNEHVLPGSFQNGRYFLVTWTIDFSTNRASAIATNPDGAVFPLFANEVFHAQARPLVLEQFEFLWLVNSSGTAGDNYLVVDSFSVEAFAAPSLAIDKGLRHRTRGSGYTLRGRQATDDAVVVEARAPGKRRWSAVKGGPVRWSFKVHGLKPGRNVVQVRLRNVLGAVIDQEKVVILRK